MLEINLSRILSNETRGRQVFFEYSRATRKYARRILSKKSDRIDYEIQGEEIFPLQICGNSNGLSRLSRICDLTIIIAIPQIESR